MAEVQGSPIVNSHSADDRTVAGACVRLGSHFAYPQPIQKETRRLIRRRIWAGEGREGLEVIEELDLVYAPSHQDQPGETDPVRVALAGIVAFIGTCLLFTFAGAGDQSIALAPLYWVGFGFLWWLLA